MTPLATTKLAQLRRLAEIHERQVTHCNGAGLQLLRRSLYSLGLDVIKAGVEPVIVWAIWDQTRKVKV